MDASSLDAELRVAGLKIHGCNSNGRVDWIDPPTPAEQATAAQVLAAHDPTKRERDTQAEDTDRRGKLVELAGLLDTWDTITLQQRWRAVWLIGRIVLAIARRLLR